MNRLVLIASRVLLRMFRKKGSLILLIALPAAGLLLPIALFSSAPEPPVRVAVSNLDNGVVSSLLLETLEKEPRLLLSTAPRENAQQAVLSGRIDCLLTIPAGWSDAFLKGEAEPLPLTSVRGLAVTTWVRQATAQFVSNASLLAIAAEGDTAVFTELFHRSQTAYATMETHSIADRFRDLNITYLGIGFLIQFMLVNAGRTASLLLEDRKHRTLARMRISPVPRATIIGGNILANFLLLTMQSAAALLLLRHVLGIQTGATMGQMLMVLLPLSLSGVGACLMLVAFAKNDNQLNTLMTLFIYPTCLLSGCFWDIRMMPLPMQQLARIFPQRWALDGLTLLMDGAVTTGALPQVGVLFAFAAAFFSLAVFGFSRSDAMAV